MISFSEAFAPNSVGFEKCNDDGAFSAIVRPPGPRDVVALGDDGYERHVEMFDELGR